MSSAKQGRNPSSPFWMSQNPHTKAYQTKKVADLELLSLLVFWQLVDLFNIPCSASCGYFQKGFGVLDCSGRVLPSDMMVMGISRIWFDGTCCCSLKLVSSDAWATSSLSQSSFGLSDCKENWGVERRDEECSLQIKMFWRSTLRWMLLKGTCFIRKLQKTWKIAFSKKPRVRNACGPDSHFARYHKTSRSHL